MSQAPGYLIHDGRAHGGELEERDTVQCPHCEGVIERVRRGSAHDYYQMIDHIVGEAGRLHVRRERREVLWCSDCSAWVCDTPACGGVCTPFVRRLECALRAWEFAQAAGLALR